MATDLSPTSETASSSEGRPVDAGPDSGFTFAHLSDWHATTLAGAGVQRFVGKRISGWASWALNRRHQHDPRILEAAIRDVEAQSVDRVLVTGDLTHISLPSEFRRAAEQLAMLGAPDRVFLVPGNHDCYVKADPRNGLDVWAPYLRGEVGDAVESAFARHLAPPPGPERAPTWEEYPTLRRAGRVAMVGLCSAIPTPIFRAGGTLGTHQLERLDALLAALGEAGLFRVLLIHHPIAAGTEPTRRALWDGDALREVLARHGAELVLHGHKHRRRLRFVPGPQGEIPIVGVPSSSEVGSRPERAAQYHVYRVTEADGAFRLEATVRGYDRAANAFVELPDALLEPED